MTTKKKSSTQKNKTTQEHLNLRALVRRHARKPGGMTVAEIYESIQNEPEYAGLDLVPIIELCLDELAYLGQAERFGDRYVAWSYYEPTKKHRADTRCPSCSYQGGGNSLTTICPRCRRFSVE